MSKLSQKQPERKLSQKGTAHCADAVADKMSVRYYTSMVLEFTKMSGAGNDFVLVDNRAQTIRLNREQIDRLCDRHRGIGADGVILLVPPASKDADWAWQFYNSDGSTG